ncbi:HalOD1 output domain-containing protein [Halostella litorea]|uniref:HalOD1 output domain-containing protein n=1 Tax=Halostella litorea TaxID=2528831 RepID=UPI00109264B4|nr:HalOD1 output domain-containing protein [Halostella litorea]
MNSERDQRDDADFRYELSDDEPPSEAVLTAVSTLSGDDVIPEPGDGGTRALPPLYDAVDPDALDSLLDDGSRLTGFDGHVSFTYHGYEVTVHSHGYLTLRRPVLELAQ